MGLVQFVSHSFIRMLSVAGVRNPILVAESLLRTQMAGEMSLGRVPPRYYWKSPDLLFM